MRHAPGLVLTPSLESPRLVMRPWADDDLAPYARLIADREVMRHMGGGWRYEVKRTAASAVAAVSQIEARRDLRRLKSHWARHGWGEWAVEERATGAFIGRVGFKYHPDFEADPSRIEIGWMLLQHVWGRGYASEGAALALTQGFEQFGLKRVISITSPANRRSLGVMRRLGMAPAGRTRWHGLDVVWSAIERPDWQGRYPVPTGGGRMSLEDNQVRATIAVSDIDRAKQFYEGKLGLTAQEGGADEIRIYECGNGSLLQVYPSPEHAGKGTATVASWSVPEFDAQVDELLGAGVEFAKYDDPVGDERGVHTFGDHKVVWFEDPDGNVIAVDNGSTY